MAGETTTGDELTTIPTEYKGSGYQVCVLDKTHEVATGELEIGDIIQVGTIPEGAILLDGYLASDDLDTNGTPLLTLEVGDAADDNGLLVANTVGQAGGVARFDGAYLVTRETKTAETTIQVTVAAAAATAAAGTIRVVLFYVTP